jgi:hypothetical protein
MAGKFDITDIRFQPYRLTESKCYDADDARISCLACHDPHRAVDSKAVDYDSSASPATPAARPLRRLVASTTNCASCPMPKLELPGGHHKFTDHRIRIVRANEPFPG